MNQLAYHIGYMKKTAGAAQEALGAGKLMALTGTPLMVAGAAGMAQPHITAPSTSEVDRMQAEQVRDRILESLANLEQSKKIKRMEEQLDGGPRSIRI
jgi:hypothetical protein